MSDSHMQRALYLADCAARAGEVPVGAVIVDPVENLILAEAHNQSVGDHDPTGHAEIIALRRAAEKRQNYRLKGLHLYVTLEPCVMCAGAISLARLETVVFAAQDKKGGAILNGPKFFDQPTCHWRPNVVEDRAHADAAAEQLKSFFKARRKN